MPSKRRGTEPTPATDLPDATQPYRVDNAGEILTTNQGTAIAHNQDSLRQGVRGPTLLEDFILREKITHFDHERIPERVVHARGSGAHGFFECYQSMAQFTRASFLSQAGKRTPVFARFSTVQGSRGSADAVRDVRGFSVKFYTDEGNYDFVGNNIPVFFIQDAMKFPDFVHAVKPEPNNEIPQGASAHDTFWDFVSLVPESTHMLLWVMSDRAIPRSLRMIQGFGVHTFRFVNAEGVSHFVKLHWKPKLGAHSLVWDEAQKWNGVDPDNLRRDLWEAIDKGHFPEWELGAQLIPEEDEGKFDFDLLDATKLVPEELVPVTPLGRMVLDRNPDNFFAETEQAAFHPGHVVPGIDFSNDPLLQGRLFSYTDTQLIRLGGPNFHEIPINRPRCPLHNNQRDGYMRQTIAKGRVAYEPASLEPGTPVESPQGFVSHPAVAKGPKVRERSETFADHYSQATLFWNSQAPHEKDHIVQAFAFELAQVETIAIRQRVVDQLARVDAVLAARVARPLGLTPAEVDKPRKKRGTLTEAPSLSLTSLAVPGIISRKVAVLLADGADEALLATLGKALRTQGAELKLIGPSMQPVRGSEGGVLAADYPMTAVHSVQFDGVVVLGMLEDPDDPRVLPKAIELVTDAYRHFKTVAFAVEGAPLLQNVPRRDPQASDPGLLQLASGKHASQSVRAFVDALSLHRHWTRVP